MAKNKRALVYPFSGIVGQKDLKLALLLSVIDPRIGGVLIMGHRGTGKSTIVRSLRELLPEQQYVKACEYGCDPNNISPDCPSCALLKGEPKVGKRMVPIVDLPLGATEDRVVGSINIETALTEGKQSFSQGLIAKSNRGVLYIDEVNLLEDHLVDLLLDVAASGVNLVEREGISIKHPARFVLIGSGNPEEGDLRPQLLDRFGLSARIETLTDIKERIEVIKQRSSYDNYPEVFMQEMESAQRKIRNDISYAQKHLLEVVLPDEGLEKIAEICARLQVDGHRGELTMCRASVAMAAYHRKKKVGMEHIKAITSLCLGHRLRKDPLETVDDIVKITQVFDDVFGGDNATQ